MTNETTIDGRNVRLYRSMYDYVEDADFGYYEIQDGKVRKTPFVEAVKPYEDSNFGVWINDKITYEGNTYVKVNFGEDDSEVESFLLESALDEEVFLIYNKIEIRGNEAAYRANTICYRTEELAYLSGNLD